MENMKKDAIAIKHRKLELAEENAACVGYGSLLRSGAYSDLVIKCQDVTFNVHKAIICPRSKPFEAMISGDFKEAASGVVELTEEDPDIFARVLDYLYSSYYDDDWTKPWPADDSGDEASPSTKSLLINTKVYICADKWDIPKLKTFAATKFADCLPSEGFTSSFADSLRLMYEETAENDRQLKDIAIKFAGQHHRKLTEAEEFAELCRENGSIGFEILKVMPAHVQQVSRESQYGQYLTVSDTMCPSCRSTLVVLRSESDKQFTHPDKSYLCNHCYMRFN